MKKHKQMITYMLLFLQTSSLLLSGCSIKDHTPILTINDKKLYQKDFIYDIYLVETEGERMENYIQDTLDVSYWDYEQNGSSMRELAKDSVLSRVVLYEILSDQANQNGISLSQQELSQNQEAISQIMQTVSEEDIKRLGITREIISDSYNKIALGDKYYKELLNGFYVNEDVIHARLNPEDYREYKTECLFLPYTTGEDNKAIFLSNGKSASLKPILSEVLFSSEQGVEFAELLNEDIGFVYMTRDFIYGDSSCEKEYQEAAMQLKNGAYSNLILTEQGYYIIHMLDNHSTQKYEMAVEEAIREEKEKQFEIYYDSLKENYNININFPVWTKIQIGDTSVTK